MEKFMDIVYLAGGVLLWGLMVLMVWAFQQLEQPRRGRPS
jgi:hypothetical protein